jgi:hypothetical protein
MSQKSINLMIRPKLISTPFVKVTIGGVEFGLTGVKNTLKGILKSDFVTSLVVNKYGSGGVNTYNLTLKYAITPGSDPNYIDLVISKASDRKIYFTYGDLSEPVYSYKEEEAIITSIKPQADYVNSTITYNITATSSSTLSYSIKKSFEATRDKPSNVLMSVLYNPEFGLIDIFRGMADRDTVLSNKWIPVEDVVVSIAEKRDYSPLDYIMYLVSLMRSDSNNYYTFKIVDGGTEGKLPHFRIDSTSNKDFSQMMVITAGYPGSIPIYKLNISENTSTALMVEYRDNVDSGIYQDYSFSGDLIESGYYSSQVVNGTPSDNLKNWWNKMTSFPVKATLTTDGLYVPADLIQSVYLDIYFFGKRYNKSGEYIIVGQEDNISSSGYFTTLEMMRIDNVQS